VILGSTEDVWTAKFKERGKTYVAPKLVLFTGTERTGCVPPGRDGPVLLPATRGSTST